MDQSTENTDSVVTLPNKDEVVPIPSTLSINNQPKKKSSPKSIGSPKPISKDDLVSVGKDANKDNVIDKEIFIVNTNQTYLDYLSDRPNRYYLYNRAFMFLKNSVTDKKTDFCKVSCELVLPFKRKVYSLFYLSVSYNYDTGDMDIFVNDHLDENKDRVTYKVSYMGVSMEDLVSKDWIKAVVNTMDVNSQMQKETTRKDIN